MGVIEDGHAATRLLENEMLKRVLADMRQGTFDTWRATPAKPEYDASLTRLKLFSEVIDAFESSLVAKVQAMEKQLFDEQQNLTRGQ